MPKLELTRTLAATAALCLLAAAPALAQGQGAAQGQGNNRGAGNSDRQGDRFTQGSGVMQDTRQTPGVTPGVTPEGLPQVQAVPPSNREATGTNATTGIGVFHNNLAEGVQWRASELIGQTIYNRQNEPIAEVKELVVDRDGRVTTAIVGVGGVLGTLGQRRLAINYASFQTVVDTQNKSQRLMLDVDSNTLRDAPEFRTPDAWNRP